MEGSDTTEYLSQLSLPHRAYFEGLIESGAVGSGESHIISRVVDILNEPGDIRGRMEAIACTLRERVISPEVTVPSNFLFDIDIAWAIVSQIAEDHLPFFTGNDIAVFVKGSLIFRDPHNFDLDMIYFLREKNKMAEMHLIRNIEVEIERQWKMISDGGLNWHVVSMQSIEMYLSYLKQGKLGSIRAAADDIDVDFAVMSVLLRGYPVFLPEGYDLEAMRKKVLNWCEEEPLLGALILTSLEDCLAIRLERQNEPESLFYFDDLEMAF